jgi:hypothetical protein
MGLFDHSRHEPEFNITMVPAINTFVHVVISGRSVQDVPIDEISSTKFVTRPMQNIEIGTSAIVDYENTAGHFRFASTCIEANTVFTSFSIPREIREIGTYIRSANLLEAMVRIKWRYAPDGAGYGYFSDDTFTSISNDGATMILPRNVKLGTLLEVQIYLAKSTAIRIAKITSIKKVIITSGVFQRSLEKFEVVMDFVHDRKLNDREIADYINGRQTGYRKRAMTDLTRKT